MLYSVVGLLPHNMYTFVDGVARATSMTSKSVSVPMTTTGYGSSNSTKVVEQRRRAQRCTSNDAIFDDNTPTVTSQAAFLANSHNKNRLIQAVREKMPMFGICVEQAEADADTLII